MGPQQLRLFAFTIFLAFTSKCDSEIPDLCETVDDVYLNDGETTDITGSTVSLNGNQGSVNRVYQCWRIMPGSRRTDRVIQLTINKIITKPTEDVPNNVKCTYQLNVMEGTRYVLNKTIAQRCSVGQGVQVEHAVTPVTIHSTESYVFVRYYNKLADPPEVWMNVTAELESLPDSIADCQKVSLGTGQGTNIISDGYPGDFPRDTFQCWMITNTDDSGLFEVHFEDIDLGSATDCYDKLDIFTWNDSATSRTKLLYRLCSDTFKGNYIYLTKRALLFRFTTNSIQHHGGFKINTRSVSKTVDFSSDRSLCSDIHVLPSGTPIQISSPNYPSYYENDMDMCWRIRMNQEGTSPGYSVNLITNDFHLDPSWQMCSPYDIDTIAEDRVDFILENKVAEANWSMCGANQYGTTNIFSSPEPFYIQFRSNQVVTDSGFSFTLFTESSDCEEVFISPPKTENISLSVAGNKDMCTKLTVRTEFDLDRMYSQDAPGYAYAFIIHLDITFLRKSGNCQTDYLQIYDGSTSLDNVLYSICGNETAKSEAIYSSSHQVLIKVRASEAFDGNIPVKAARANLVAAMRDDAMAGHPVCRTTELSAAYKSSSRLTISQSLASPTTDCETLFTNRTGHKLQMKIDWSQTSFGPPRSRCDNRFVTISDIVSDVPIMHVCLHMVDGVITSYNNGFSMIALAQSEETLLANFDLVEKNRYGSECIGIPIKNNNEKYFISTPNFPYAYPPNLDMCWQAYLVEPNRHKRLHFEMVILYGFHHDDCDSNKTGTNDTLTLSNDKGEILRHSSLCQLSNFISLTFCSQTKYAMVRFKSDSVLATRGFMAYFTVDPNKGCPSGKASKSDNDDFFTLRNILLVAGGGLLLLLLLCCFIYCCCCRKKKQQTGPDSLEVGTYRHQTPNEPPPEYDDTNFKTY